MSKKDSQIMDMKCGTGMTPLSWHFPNSVVDNESKKSERASWLINTFSVFLAPSPGDGLLKKGMANHFSILALRTP